MYSWEMHFNYVNGGNAGYQRGYYISGDSGNNYYTDQCQ